MPTTINVATTNIATGFDKATPLFFGFCFLRDRIGLPCGWEGQLIKLRLPAILYRKTTVFLRQALDNARALLGSSEGVGNLGNVAPSMLKFAAIRERALPNDC